MLQQQHSHTNELNDSEHFNLHPTAPKMSDAKKDELAERGKGKLLAALIAKRNKRKGLPDAEEPQVDATQPHPEIVEIASSVFLSSNVGACHPNPTGNLLCRPRAAVDATTSGPFGIRCVIVPATNLQPPEHLYRKELGNFPQTVSIGGTPFECIAKFVALPHLDVATCDLTEDQYAAYEAAWRGTVSEHETKLRDDVCANTEQLVEVPIYYCVLAIEDNAKGRLCRVWPAAFPLLREFNGNGLVGGGTLVHCLLGKSRSVSLIAAHLIAHGGMSLESSMTLLKERRPAVDPNINFRMELLKLEKTLDK